MSNERDEARARLAKRIVEYRGATIGPSRDAALALVNDALDALEAAVRNDYRASLAGEQSPALAAAESLLRSVVADFELTLDDARVIAAELDRLRAENAARRDQHARLLADHGVEVDALTAELERLRALCGEARQGLSSEYVTRTELYADLEAAAKGEPSKEGA